MTTSLPHTNSRREGGEARFAVEALYPVLVLLLQFRGPREAELVQMSTDYQDRRVRGTCLNTREREREREREERA